MSFPRSDEEYVKHPGECPFCGSDAITGESVEVDGTHATQEVACIECEAEWTDVYELKGYIT